MTVLSFDPSGVHVNYEGIEFRLEKSLIEEATQKSYQEVTDHEVIRLIDKQEPVTGEPQKISEIISRNDL